MSTLLEIPDMPKNYQELVTKAAAESFCYQRAKMSNALATPGSRELDILYKLVAREMAEQYPPLIIPYVEVTVSPQCTLHCVDCANLMPLYEKPKPMDLDAVEAWTTGFLEAVDYVLTFRVMGGEPFMQKKLDAFLEFLLARSKIQNLQVVSNGTLPIPKSCIPCLQHPKASLWISNYGDAVPGFRSVVEQALSLNIPVQSTRGVMAWLDMGDLSCRTHDVEILKTVYRHCDMNCRHIWNGEFHVCPRSAHGRALGLFEVPERDFVRVQGNVISWLRQRTRELYDVGSISTWAYCNSKGDRTPIPSARQRSV